MVCYGCGIDLHGYQAYRSLYCSQCLNRRAVEEQTRTQARIAERQLELQREQLEQFEEQREEQERRLAEASYVRTTKVREREEPLPDPDLIFPPTKTRPLSVIQEEMNRTGNLPNPNEYSRAIDIANKETGEFVRSITESDSGKNARSYREIMQEYWDDPDGNLPDLTELITAALAHKKKISEGYKSAVSLAKEKGAVTIGSIQRHVGTGYSDTVEILNEMELNGVIAEPDSDTGIRKVLAD